MTECQTTELQDLLPDFVAGALSPAEMIRVEAHLSACPSCVDDVSLLRAVRTLRPRAMTVDGASIARIVAALPRPGEIPDAQPMHPARPVLVRTASAMGALPGTSRTRWRWREHHTLLRMAATVVVMLAGTASLLLVRQGVVPDRSNSAAAVAELPRGAVLAESLTLGSEMSHSLTSDVDVPVSYGDLGDYNEVELQAMLERLDQWDGATSTEPLPGVPVVAVYQGSGPL